MSEESKSIGAEYREASSDSFASVVRSVAEIQGLQAIAAEMAEQSRRSMGRAFEIQAQLAKSACDAYVFQLTKLGQMMFTGYGMFRTRPEVRLPIGDIPKQASASEACGNRATAASKGEDRRATDFKGETKLAAGSEAGGQSPAVAAKSERKRRVAGAEGGAKRPIAASKSEDKRMVVASEARGQRTAAQRVVTKRKTGEARARRTKKTRK